MRCCCAAGSAGGRILPPVLFGRDKTHRRQKSTAGVTRVLIGLLVAAAVCPAQDYVDQVVERARKDFEVPGIAVAIVKGYGVRKLGEPAAWEARG